MSETPVKQLAKIVGTPVEELLQQLKEAGITAKGAEDSITDQDKLKLLEYIRATQTNGKPQVKKKAKMSLNRRSNSELNISGRTVNIAVKHKKSFAQATPIAAPPVETKPTTAPSSRTEILAQQLEKERKAREQATIARQQQTEKKQQQQKARKIATIDETNTVNQETITQEAITQAVDVVESSRKEKTEVPEPPVSDTKKTVVGETTVKPSAQSKQTSEKPVEPLKEKQEALAVELSTEVPVPKQKTANTPTSSIKKDGVAEIPKAEMPKKETPKKETSPSVLIPDDTPLTTAAPLTPKQMREIVAARSKKEAALSLKRRPSRKPPPRPVVKAKPAPTVAKKPATPAKPVAPKKPEKKKPFQGRSQGPGSKLHIKGGRRQKKKSRRARQVVVEQSTEHGFEKPTAPVIHHIEIPDTIVVSELAQKLAVKGADIIRTLMGMGVMATINQVVDQDTAILIVEEMGHTASAVKTVDEEISASELIDNLDSYSKVSRPPVVTIMGHVDHGKTSLLDYIRQSRVAAGEAGGITQHIDAYHVETDNGIISFLDTPGHAAFSSMRQRGAQATDIVIVVVAADDGVMPQTEEAIKHTRKSGAPLIIAINKIDKEQADPERVKNDLANYEVVPDDWGGDDVCVNISAKVGTGIDDLLDAILLQAEVMELEARTDGPATGVVIESRVEKGRGAVASLLVQEGTLRKGDIILCGSEYGRIRAMLDENGKAIIEATPSIPVEIQGLSGTPSSGSELVVLQNERQARELAEKRREKERETRFAAQQAAKLDEMFEKMKPGEKAVFNILLKTDVHGSLEAIRQSLNELSTSEVAVKIISSSIGGITETDVTLAQSAEAIILGFNVRADAAARRYASEVGVETRYYSIIYELIDDVRDAMSGLLKPELREELIGIAEVKDTFRGTGFGRIAGCLVIEGTIKSGEPIRVLRDSVVIHEGELDSLRRHQDNVSEVKVGTECGIGVKAYDDIRTGDQIEVFHRYEVERTLSKD
ncbi:MAG: translation initiation factor IF-2 [Cocleimonas sp.]|nr:translation initiation factor IF-2 [Cocleimonas sp.]